MRNLEFASSRASDTMKVNQSGKEWTNERPETEERREKCFMRLIGCRRPPTRVRDDSAR